MTNKSVQSVVLNQLMGHLQWLKPKPCNTKNLKMKMTMNKGESDFTDFHFLR